MVNTEKVWEVLVARIQQDFADFVPAHKTPSPRHIELEKRVQKLTTQFKDEMAKLGEKVAQALAEREQALNNVMAADQKAQNYKVEMERMKKQLINLERNTKKLLKRRKKKL